MNRPRELWPFWHAGKLEGGAAGQGCHCRQRLAVGTHVLASDGPGHTGGSQQGKLLLLPPNFPQVQEKTACSRACLEPEFWKNSVSHYNSFEPSLSKP
jgi:hypothetical protein